MPAAKSRKRLPSMSSTVRPSPRRGTIGYARGRLGDVHAWSKATWARAFGPGSSVVIFGTGRSPATRDTTDDKAPPRHLMHRTYAVWIFGEPSIAGPWRLLLASSRKVVAGRREAAPGLRRRIGRGRREHRGRPFFPEGQTAEKGPTLARLSRLRSFSSRWLAARSQFRPSDWRFSRWEVPV